MKRLVWIIVWLFTAGDLAAQKAIDPPPPIATGLSGHLSSRPPNTGISPDALIIGPWPDTLLIDTDTVQEGDIILLGRGVLIIEGAVLTLSGNLAAQGSGQIILRDGARLHFNQSYVGQYYLWLAEHAAFQATDATVDANGVMHFMNLYDNASYTAKRTEYPDWSFRQVYDRARLILEDVDHVGDIFVTDSSFVQFTRCDTLMPWLFMPGGSVVNVQFPDPAYVEHFEFSDLVPGIDGIGYRLLVDSSSSCWWSTYSFSGSQVTVENSIIRGSAVWITDLDTASVEGIANYTLFGDFILPLADRHLEYRNTYVYWWNWYPAEGVTFTMDSCVFGEMIGHESSTIHATRSICDGSTIHLAAIDSSFVTFRDGLVLSFVGAWNKATLLLIDTSVLPLWPYQAANLSHDEAKLFAVNSDFLYPPEALDESLVMFAAIDGPSTASIDQRVPIMGSAWIDVGPGNPTTFQGYRLQWSRADTPLWAPIHHSTNEVSHDTLGVWDTTGLTPGEYRLRLIIAESGGERLKALFSVELTGTDTPIGTRKFPPGPAGTRR